MHAHKLAQRCELKDFTWLAVCLKFQRDGPAKPRPFMPQTAFDLSGLDAWERPRPWARVDFHAMGHNLCRSHFGAEEHPCVSPILMFTRGTGF